MTLEMKDVDERATITGADMEAELAHHDALLTTIESQAPTWFISADWSGSCDDVCQTNGGTCSQSALDGLGLSGSNRRPDALRTAYESATGSDLECSRWNEGCT